MRGHASEGQGLVEYALIISCIALVAVGGFIVFTEALVNSHNGVFTRIAAAFGV